MDALQDTKHNLIYFYHLIIHRLSRRCSKNILGIFLCLAFKFVPVYYLQIISDGFLCDFGIHNLRFSKLRLTGIWISWVRLKYIRWVCGLLNAAQWYRSRYEWVSKITYKYAKLVYLKNRKSLVDPRSMALLGKSERWVTLIFT